MQTDPKKNREETQGFADLQERLEELQRVLGYRFHRPSLLELALRHDSLANESESALESNQRLEFLGDSVLGLVICDYLYHHFPDLPEGRLARYKAQIVSTEQLAERAREIRLGHYLLFGRGEQSLGPEKSSVLADAMEAVMGAVFLDRGFEASAGFVLKIMQPTLAKIDELTPDYKSLLQELTQKEFQILPLYQLIAEDGPSHDKTFQMEVRVGEQFVAVGLGRSKRDASQKAACQVISAIEEFLATVATGESNPA